MNFLSSQKKGSGDTYDVLVLGAGPAGLMAAITAAQAGYRTAILEKNATAGRKLLLSGSGRCNVTHAGSMEDMARCYGDQERFVKPALLAYTNEDLLRFLATEGVRCVTLEGGKIFPQSQKSGDILRVFLQVCERLGVAILPHQPVRQILPSFKVSTPTDTFSTKSVILAMGGKTFPATGSNGDGFRLAAALGHTIVPPRPALAPAYIVSYTLEACAGVSIPNAEILHERDGRTLRTLRDDLLFTHFGLSGPVLLNGSRWMAPGDMLTVRLGDVTRLLEVLAGRRELKNQLAEAFCLPERLVETLLIQAGLDPKTRACDVLREERRLLEKEVLQPRFRIARLGDDSEAKATAGGVSLSEVNRKTMQSRRVPGLFFCGEVLDVDGDTGGYNLQFAFSSGVLAGSCAGSCAGSSTDSCTDFSATESSETA